MRLWTAARVPAAQLNRHPTTLAGDRPLLLREPDGTQSILSSRWSVVPGLARGTLSRRAPGDRTSKRTGAYYPALDAHGRTAPCPDLVGCDRRGAACALPLLRG